MRLLKLIAVNLILLFFLLALFEWVLEIVNPYERHHSVLSRHIQLRETGLPNISFYETPHPIFEKYTERLELKNYSVELDSMGFISSKNNSASAKKNIIFIGGSTTECRYVEDSLRFPSLVGENLRARNISINTFNGGVERSHSGHSLNVFMQKIMHHNFDVAIWMHNINDLVHLSYNGSYTIEKNTESRRTLATLARPDFDNPDLYFFRKHGIGMRLEKSFQVLFPRLHYDLSSAKAKMESGQNPLEFGWEKMEPMGEKQYDEFRKNIRSFIALCRANDIQPILMTQFNRINEKEFSENPIYSAYKKRLEDSAISVFQFCGNYNYMNEIIRKEAERENVSLIDLDKSIPKNIDYMYDMVHLHGEGSKYVSEIISDSLLVMLKEK